MTVYDIRVKADTTGYYARHAGVTFGTRDTREEAQSVIDAAFYGAEWAEIVEREVAA